MVLKVVTLDLLVSIHDVNTGSGPHYDVNTGIGPHYDVNTGSGPHYDCPISWTYTSRV